ncbi:S-Ena type endospore appendage [Bacillus sp. SCS-151]|uniref:S-Ena type endospore appendage n=1 Tax=Nanhaiella sioensis TaxID=3115293 RepID=UPI0039791812
MGKYTTSSCCGSTKITTAEKTACCDCPTFVNQMNSSVNLSCGASEYTIFTGNTQGSLSGTISTNGAGTGPCSNATIRILSNNTLLHQQDLIVTQNFSFSFNNVTRVTASCSGGNDGDMCEIKWELASSERCITNSPPPTTFSSNSNGP